MAQRNYPCDHLLHRYFGNSTQRVNYYNATGEQEFQGQLYLCMLGQTLFLKSDIEQRRSDNQWGALTWQLNEMCVWICQF